MNSPQSLAHDWFPKPLPANVRLGDRSWCYSSFSCCHFQSRHSEAVRVGHDTGIYHGTFFELGPEGEVEIGNYCTLVGAIVSTNARVTIGDYAFIAHEVLIADRFDAVPFDDRRSKNNAPIRDRRADEICIGGNSWICARAILLAGARIGEGAIVGAAAVVDFEVPPFAIVAGNPARITGWTNKPRKRSG